MIGLCDCNNFFVSCERVFNPSLNERPVIVLSNNDGCVVSRSNEAKAIGIKMGEPLFQVRDIIKRENVAVFSSNYQLYGDMSQRVMATLKKYIQQIEIYSIDEAFLSLEGIPTEQLKKFGEELARIIRRDTGIPVSIGISHTKTLAKIAAKLCKKYPKLNGACLMHREEDIAKVLSTYPIGDVWGIGRRHTKSLTSCNIHTAAQFCALSEEWVQNRMSITGVRTWKELHGTACIELSHNITERESISLSRSFSKELYSFEELHEAISTFAAIGAEKLRKQKSAAGMLQVFILTNRYREDTIPQTNSAVTYFITPTDSSLEIVKASVELLKGIYCSGIGYKKAGIRLSNIIPANCIQRELFDTIDRSKHKLLMDTIDKINAAQGSRAVKIVSQGEITDHTNRQYLSPQYTTDWNDILVIKL